jgi:hypothetical protein
MSSRSPEFLPLAAETGIDVPCPEVEELEVVGLLRVVDLVGDEDPGLPRAAEQVDDPRVARMHARLGVDDEQHQVGLGDRLLHLTLDRDVHRQVGVLDQAAGVHEPEGTSLPLGEREVAVTRGARLLADDGGVVPDDAVEERRLAHVGAADERDDRDISHCPRSRRAQGSPRARARR